MAPVPDSLSFPSLDKCLDGGHLLTSWRTAALGLGTRNRDAHLQVFFSDETNIQLLAHPFKGFPIATAQTNSAFQTKTAAINVAPHATNEYDINEFKENALWLSSETKIDELSALRIVVLDYQNRSSSQLLSGFSSEEAASLKEVSGNINTETSNLVTRLVSSSTILQSDEAEAFSSQENRRARLLRLYLSERRYISICAKIIFPSVLEIYTNGPSKGKSKAEDSSLQESTSEAILNLLQNFKDGHNQFLREFTITFQARFDQLEQGSGWMKDASSREAFELDWMQTQIATTVYEMEIMLWVLEAEKKDKPRSSVNSIRPSNVVLPWFQFVSAYGFFDQFEGPHPSLQILISALRALATVVSVSLLDPWSSSSYIADNEGDDYTQGDTNAPYFQDLKGSSALNDIFLDAASGLSYLASPSVFAWSLILIEIRNITTARREARELIQSERAVESVEGNESRTFPQSERRRESAGSDISLQPGIYDTAMEMLQLSTPGQDVIEVLARSAVDGCNVFDVLASLTSPNPALSETSERKICLIVLDSIRCSYSLISYTPEGLNTVLSALTSNASNKSLPAATLEFSEQENEDPAKAFMFDDVLRGGYLGIAISRYPYESLPFLKLAGAVAGCKTLNEENGAPLSLMYLENLRSFTHELPHDFRDYTIIMEDENANAVKLTRPINLFESRNTMKLALQGRPSYSKALASRNGLDDFNIPVETTGRIISDSGPKVAVWFHPYMGLTYLGKLLETALTSAEHVDATTGQPIDIDSTVAIITILKNLVQSSAATEEDKISGHHGITQHILEQASDGLSRNRDIVSVVFGILEEQLQRPSDSFKASASMDLLVVCIEFITALLWVLPGRVWPFLARSSLLDVEGHGSKLTSILSSIELVTGKYDFVISCLYLYEGLIVETAFRAVLRKTGSKKMVRVDRSEDLGAGVPSHTLSKVLCSFTRTAVEIFSTACNWNYVDQSQRLLVTTIIAESLSVILTGVYGVDDTSEPSSKLYGVLSSSASHIMDSFMSESSGYLRFQPFLRALLDGLSTPDPSYNAKSSLAWQDYVRSVLGLSTTLAKLGSLLGRPAINLEIQLFKASSLLARLYATNESYRTPVLDLLKALAVHCSDGAEEPLSLMGNMGSRTAKHFIHMLSDLALPVISNGHSTTVWKFLSAMISNRQQWFAIYLLTGRSPRETSKDVAKEQSNRSVVKPMLKVAMEEVCDINKLPKEQAIAILEFISLAQNFWPWAIGDIQKNFTFLRSLTDYVAKLEPWVASAKQSKTLECVSEGRIAALIAEILAMTLYHSRQLGDLTAAKEVSSKIGYFTRCAVSVPSYNASLHGNLKQNFEARFQGCSLQDFKLTYLTDRVHGIDYFYDTSLAHTTLHYDEAWMGKKNDGLGEEFEKANINLSLVDSQVTVFRGWNILAIELSTNLKGDISLQNILAKTATDCLVSNIRSQLPENIFTQLGQSRADLALILTQRLSEAGCKSPEALEMLKTVWETIRTAELTFDSSFSSGDAAYYRTLLKILFLALRGHASAREELPDPAQLDHSASRGVGHKIETSTAKVQMIVDIIDKVVSCGFRDIARSIHEQPGASIPEDISLITAILQACLRVPGVELCHHQIVQIMTANDTSRLITTMFSWSGELAIDGDPIYGELSVLFLLELSTMPPMAEQLAIEGVLGQISAASIMRYLTKASISPYAESAGPQRCYSIWVHGVLPLLLNILDAVGSSVAAEVANFLNQFPKLVQASVTTFEAPDIGRSSRLSEQQKHVTYGNVSEVHSLALIMFILSTFRDSMVGITEVPEVQWDAVNVLEGVEFWLGRRHVLREKILPLGPREEILANQKAEGDFQNRLEEKITNELLGIRDILAGGEL